MRPAAHARRLGVGRLIYQVWHRPRAALIRGWREGGPINQFITRRGRLAMMAAAPRLPALPAPPAGAPEVAFLTGRDFWFQTAFCGWTLGRLAGRPLRITFFDDGTIDEALAAESQRLFPGSVVQTAVQIESRLDQHLPASRFPVLRARRLVYPNLRKLIDVHVGGSTWRLVLDSDLLFFRRPDLLVSWLERPDRPLHMTDVQDAYGYPRELMEDLAGRPVPRRLNVGLCGLRSDELDWERIEFWCRTLQEKAGTSYYQEQALVAMLLAGRDCIVAPADDYRIMPPEEEAARPTAVMHHYVDLSKRGYYRHAWRLALFNGMASGSSRAVG